MEGCNISSATLIPQQRKVEGNCECVTRYHGEKKEKKELPKKFTVPPTTIKRSLGMLQKNNALNNFLWKKTIDYIHRKIPSQKSHAIPIKS